MKEYIYDGSFEGFLTAVFHAYSDKNSPTLTRVSHYTPSLFAEPLWVLTREDLYDRVTSSIKTKLSHSILSTAYFIYLSEIPGSETVFLHYLRLCYQHGVQINLAKNNETIRAIDDIYRKVHLEKHRFYGFVRFREIGPLQFYAKIEPDHHILPLLESHFVDRFKDQAFIIHDPTRCMALIYTKKESFLRMLSKEENEKLSTATIHDDFEDLFRTFYASVTIQNRLNPKLQKGFMPKRYWKNIIETSQNP
jgi:probable DNA metabolism protein